MTKPPLPILLLSWLFILVGIVGIVYHAREINLNAPFEAEVLLGIFVRLAAIAGGALLLRGFGWARWILVLWAAYHVTISAMHSVPQFVLHLVVLAVVAYICFRRQTSEFFQST